MASSGFFIITLDAVVINVVLPTLARDFHADMRSLQWVLDSYTLAFAALLLSAGALSDRLGARLGFGLGLIIFIFASVGCGLAPTLHVLIAARICQGAGAALMMPSSMSLIRQGYEDPAQRGRAIALWAMGGAVASTSGPVIGGLLAAIDWRWIFFVNIPAGLATLALLVRTSPSPRRTAPFDYWGQVSAVVAMAALTFSAIEMGSASGDATSVLLPLSVAVAALAAFLALQMYGTHPMVPPSLFRPRNPRIAMMVGFTFMVGYFGLPFLMSLYLQEQRGLSPVATGATFLPMMLTGLFLTPFSTRLASRYSSRVVIASGLLLMAAGLGLIAFLPPSTAVPYIGAAMVLVGLAGPLVAPPMASVLLTSVPASLAGTASGVFNTSRQVGGALAVALFGSLLARSPNFLDGLHISLLLAVGLSLATAIVSLGIEPPNP
ncbi:MFS transporter [Cupriavidus sp. CV2]|uniref:MFS transporter n=1 Tax=Cupriavidus ulmosensis TaxID=3065913 RepID=UPI00296B3D09|nr:MFS transporter [Cupriavidus sp. CV2]MDW3682774.1 MFS transporter [Cupriavidus sp. CV2]